MAEEEGFEPPYESPRKRFSRPPVSTTHPFLQIQSYLISSRVNLDCTARTNTVMSLAAVGIHDPSLAQRYEQERKWL